MATESERACLVRLQEMDVALANMERELPDDVRPVGAEARRRVAVWLQRIAAGEADMGALGDDMREIGVLMDSLTERLLLAAWDPGKGPKH